MDPEVMKAFTRGKEVGHKAGYSEGKVDGMMQLMMLFETWIEEMDSEVHGIGKKKKEDIREFFAKKIATSIQERTNHLK